MERVGAICAAIVTLLLLIGWLVEPVAFGESRVDVLLSERYAFATARILVQVVFMLFALLALAFRLGRTRQVLALFTIVFVAIWQVLELVPRGMELFAISKWAEAVSDTSLDPALLQRITWTADIAGALGDLRRYFWMLAQGGFALMLYQAGRGWLPKALAVLAAIAFLRMALYNAGLDAVLAMLPVSGTELFYVNVTPFFALLTWYLWRDARESEQ